VTFFERSGGVFAARDKMANTRSAIKRIRQNEKRREHNRTYRSRARTFVKKARTTQQGTDLNAAIEATRLAIKDLDMAASRGVIHPNNAARRKSRLMKQLNAMRQRLQTK
jgi:small subunit ribosomal protein S20